MMTDKAKLPSTNPNSYTKIKVKHYTVPVYGETQYGWQVWSTTSYTGFPGAMLRAYYPVDASDSPAAQRLAEAKAAELSEVEHNVPNQ